MLFDDWRTISKSHRYSRKEFKDGMWHYYYDKDASFSRMTQCKSKTLKINASMTEKAIVSIAENYIKNVWIADWKAHPAKAICKELKGKKIFFKDISYEHLKKTGKNSLVGKGNRNKQNLLKHVKYLPCAKELLESNGVHTQSRYQQFSSPRKDGAVGIVYQTLSGIAPAGDNNNYVQAVVSRKKYKDGTLSDMVYISVFGSKDIKKGTDFTLCLTGATPGYAANDNTKLTPATNCVGLHPTPFHTIPQDHPSVNESVADRIRAILGGGMIMQEHNTDVDKSDFEEIEKSARYIRRWLSNGEWRYKYPAKYKGKSNRTQTKMDIAKGTHLITGVSPLLNPTEEQIDEALVHLSLQAMDGKLKCSALGNSSVYIIGITQQHIKETHNKPRIWSEITHKAKYIPFVPHILANGKICEKSSSKQGVIYGIIGQVEYFDEEKNKTIKECVELAINFDKDTRKFVFSFSDFKIKKSLPSDRDFGNSLACPIVDTETVPITTYSLAHNTSIVNKSVEISIVDITEGNKEEKLVQFAKALDCLSQGKKPMVKRVKADATERLPDIIMHFKRVDKNRIVKALNGAAMVLKSSVPVKGEAFTYRCHKDMMERINRDIATLAHKTYSFVQSYFGLPEITTMSKADMRWKGRLIYSPETGRPITQKEWKAFVDALERFMNRNYSGLGERWVLSAEAMGRLLDRMVSYQSLEAVQNAALRDFKYGTKTYDWISDSVKNLRTTMGESLTRSQQARIEVARQSAAQRVTNVKDATRNKIQQIIIDGVRDRKSKSQVSQALFDSCASMNRDMQRIADSEYQMAMNRAYIAEEVRNCADGEKVYFQRFEMLDAHTCKKCERLKGKVAIWSETPLPDEKVRDEYASYAIWEGKVDGDAPVDILHPWCRGSWIRWNPPAQTRRTDAYTAYMSGLSDAWDNAVKAAREEWGRKGVANPTDKTPGYVDRCRELFQFFSNK